MRKNLVRSLQAAYPNASVLLTGHSLGGALAAMVARSLNLNAVMFNAVPEERVATILIYLKITLRRLFKWVLMEIRFAMGAATL
jgi:putative lipase involved disintegration of autophagic bodies